VKINMELHRLKQQIMDEVVKVRTDTKLDFNLEKSRVKELYSLNERKLLEMRTEMVALVRNETTFLGHCVHLGFIPCVLIVLCNDVLMGGDTQVLCPRVFVFFVVVKYM